MPPKQIVTNNKGQTSLFSFFNKAKPTSPVAAEEPTAACANVKDATPTACAVPERVMIVEPSCDKILTPAKALEPVKTPSKDLSEPKKRSFDSTKGDRKKQSTKRSIVESDDEEWDGNDVSLSRDNIDTSQEDSEYAESDDNSDEEDESEDEFIVDSDDSDTEYASKKRKLKSGSGKKPPLPVKKAQKAVAPLESERLRKVSHGSPCTSVSSTPISQRSHSSPAPSTPSSSITKLESFARRVSEPSPGSAGSILMETAEVAGSPGSISSHHLLLPEGVTGLGSHEHDSWEFLKPSNRKDKAGRRPDHPEYNPRTLYVPQQFLNDQTPAMQQWWAFKSENMDTVLFFKVGKFYELFHMDSDIGMSELDLIYMKGSKAHSGFPEIAYGKHASALVAKGYRVARVEQTETPEMLKERNDKKGGKKDKVVLREVCSVLSKGTRTYCHLDDLSLLESGNRSQSASILVCIIESAATTSATDAEDRSAQSSTEYGVCIVDTVIGSFILAQFQDDYLRSRLRTLLAKYIPSEVLLESGNHCPETKGAVKLIASSASIDMLRSGSEMPSSAKAVIDSIARAQYFGDSSSGDDWPEVLKAVRDGIADESSSLVARAIGGALWQLRRSLIDYEIVSMKKFYAYIPSDQYAQSTEDSGAQMNLDGNINSSCSSGGALFSNVSCDAAEGDDMLSSGSAQEEEASEDQQTQLSPTAIPIDQLPSHMTLDAIALSNLEILQNNYDKTEKGSLFAFLNRCKTPFGARLLRDWVVKPLFRPQDINRRARAVDELLSSFAPQMQSVQQSVLRELPDLERLLSRVHSNGIKKSGVASHPNTRAILYDAPTYNSKKIKDFTDILTGFESLLKLHDVFKGKTITSTVLRKLLRPIEEGGKFPFSEMKSILKHFREIFDEKQANKDGFIKPKPGVNTDYDEARAEVAKNEASLDTYLREMKRITGINDLSYWGSNKDRYQIEVPMSQCNKVPKDWTTKSQKKTHRRYWTPVIEKTLSALVAAEEKVELARNDTLRRIFEKFDSKRAIWSSAVSCAAMLDALFSLALVSSSPNYVWPEILHPDSLSGASVNIQGGRHPMLEHTFALRNDGDYIPNSLLLGGTAEALALTQSSSSSAAGGMTFSPRLLLLSGPNMGGKSTLLRQTCLIAILAQLGCKVPADSCSLTPVDRIFTRVGASDRILSGMSTFFVELAETAIILQTASPHSLCILDELGRGTATFDGTAIAHAVIDHLVNTSRCRCLFATHYHSLVEGWDMDPRVRLGHMDCLVRDVENTNSNEEVTFLYRLCDGSSKRSYGLNVGRLARLPEEVLAIAKHHSQQFETKMRQEGLIRYECADQAGIDRNQWWKDKVKAYFEKLVAIANSNQNMPKEELVYAATELWIRYKSLL